MDTPNSNTALTDSTHSAENLAYMAGMIDSEGCIAIAKDDYYATPWHKLQLSVSNTDKPLMDWLKAEFGGFVCNVKRYDDKHKHGYQWYITQDGAAELLKNLMPYLVIKQEQAYLAVSFIAGKKQLPPKPGKGDPELTRRNKIYEQMKKLNKKGFVERANIKPTRGKLLPSQLDLAYMAGMVDGDGSIHIGKGRAKRANGTYKAKHELKLVVTSTSPSIIEWLFSRFDGICVISQSNSTSWKQKLDWKLSGERAANVLKLIGPHLRMKGEQGQVAQTFIKDKVKLTRGSDKSLYELEMNRRESLYLQLKALNQCGNAAATTKHQAPAALPGESIV